MDDKKKYTSFVSFVRDNGKLRLEAVTVNGNSFIGAAIYKDDERVVTLSPPTGTSEFQNKRNVVLDNDGKTVLVDFNIPKDAKGNLDFDSAKRAIKESLEKNKHKLVVSRGNKNWDDPEAEDIPVFTLVCQFGDPEALEVDI